MGRAGLRGETSAWGADFLHLVASYVYGNNTSRWAGAHQEAHLEQLWQFLPQIAFCCRSGFILFQFKFLVCFLSPLCILVPRTL